jgi:hypothetical protein
MKIVDFKKIIDRIPSKYDEYDIVFSEFELIDEKTKLKTDTTISGLISDDENKQMCLLDEESYNVSLDI